MNDTGDRPWMGEAVIAGAAYTVIGAAFALPATHLKFWRLAAWIVSGIVFVMHVGVEHVRLRSARVVAWHAAVGAAIGGFGLAAAAILRRLSEGQPTPRLQGLGFAVWPLVTGIPAFVVALVIATLLARLPQEERKR
ncbi:MAG TPA: hypothetical protein VE967_00340 [Gemmatimonadaceae bacterium]|nr:hypothetical protein [Gemmatimonadaceae bacterium]